MEITKDQGTKQVEALRAIKPKEKRELKSKVGRENWTKRFKRWNIYIEYIYRIYIYRE